MLLPVTLSMAAACAVLNLWLALRVGRRRVQKKVVMGDGGDDALFAMQRAHANFVEYAPFVLILLGGIELAGGSPTWLWAAGALFVVGRIAHGLGMTRPAPNPLRGAGTAITFLLLAVLAGWAVMLANGGTRHAAVTTFTVDSPRV